VVCEYCLRSFSDKIRNWREKVCKRRPKLKKIVYRHSSYSVIQFLLGGEVERLKGKRGRGREGEEGKEGERR
jgi:hypothetical protein